MSKKKKKPEEPKKLKPKRVDWFSARTEAANLLKQAADKLTALQVNQLGGSDDVEEMLDLADGMHDMAAGLTK